MNFDGSAVALHLFVNAMSGDHADISSCHWLERLLPVLVCGQQKIATNASRSQVYAWHHGRKLYERLSAGNFACHGRPISFFVPWKMLTGEVLLVRGERRSENEARDFFHLLT